jgi:7-methyl-GTP pyrophosphatase
MLVLASTSPYRRELLARLGLAFTVYSPGVDETPRPEETPAQTALRLAQAKAEAGGTRYPQALVIGSDQVAEVDGHRLDKPGSHERAAAQLAMLSGRCANFHTAVAVFDTASRRMQARLVATRVQFRVLSSRQIDAYLRKEQPFDCAGSAKSEGLGIALLQSVDSADPTALIGLPLIALTEMLQAGGLDVL